MPNGSNTKLIAVAFFLLVSVRLAGAQQAPAAPAPPTNDDCVACHGDPKFTRANGTPIFVDVKTFSASKHGALTCVDCHADLAKTEYPHAEKLKKVDCASCHTDIGATYQDSIHARARERAGLTVAPACANCHGAHDIRGKTDPESRVAPAHVPSTCGTCHEGIKTKYETSVHAAALKSATANAPSCATCHTAHNIQRVDTPGVRLSVIAECGTCHLAVVQAFGRTFHGKVTQLGGSVATCADCHTAHEILPAKSPASTVAHDHLQTTCGKCHAGANQSFVKYDPHPNPSDYNRSPVLWWANAFYWILIPGCFGFFGLHSVLWFWRATREARARRGTA
jgi:hypothetical protein